MKYKKPLPLGALKKLFLSRTRLLFFLILLSPLILTPNKAGLAEIILGGLLTS